MASDTLLIRHLPISLSNAEVEDFLNHMGAIQVMVRESKLKKHSIAFAKFKNKELAREALMQMHQKEVLDSRLVVEFADDKLSLDHKKTNEEKEKKIAEESRKVKLRETFLRNLNNWTIGLNFTLPPPYHLKYNYPPPNDEALRNIVNMLSYNVKFYTQVLHLMNKMNLPCPFETSFPLKENDVFNSFIIFILENYISENDLKKSKAFELETEFDKYKTESDGSSEESELESENEEAPTKSNLTPKKRPLPAKKIIKKRKLIKPTIIGVSKTTKTSVEDVFEKVDRDNPVKKIEMKISTEIPINETAAPIPEEKSQEPEPEGFGVLYPKQKTEETETTIAEETDIEEKYITAEELSANRIAERDFRVLSIFKNYQRGTPSCRLYIKNLSKNVTQSDLNYIFKRYLIKGIDEQGTMFDIRLMQEGRMKGQAFVTLQNVKQAELALKETNGFIIKDKPMVVQFARSAVAKDNAARNLSKRI